MDAKRYIDYGPTFVSPVPLEPSKTALIIVDMQDGLVTEGMGFGLAMEAVEPGVGKERQARIETLVIPTIQRLLEYFREHELRIVYLVVGAQERDYSDLPAPFRESHRGLERLSGVNDILWAGSPNFAIRADIAPRSEEIVIHKRSFGAFNTSNLDDVLRELGIEDLVIVGVGTSACVETTARDAADRGYRCVLVDEGMASYSQAAHQATLEGFHFNFGRVVKSASDVIESMSSGEPV
jgi:biuret amidohydrolase